MAKLTVQALGLRGTFEVTTLAFEDHRGSFGRLFCADELAEVMEARQVLQINRSATTARGAVRGMHFQHMPHGEMKLVRCLRGAVLDVMVDIRVGSPTYLQWQSVELTPQRANMVVVPEGFAHGFQTLEADSEVLYFTTAHYSAAFEGGIRPDDPAVAIAWPLPIGDLSAKDASHPLIDASFVGVTV